MPQDISNTTFSIRFDDSIGQFALFAGNDPIRTPGGNPVTHRDQRFLDRLRAELDGQATLDPSQLGRYSLYSTYRDNFAQGDRQFPLDEVRTLLITDRLLRTSAGPEVTAQLANMGSLSRLLKSHGWAHLNLPQYRGHEDVEAWIAELGPECATAIDELVRGLHLELSTLHPAQLTVVVNVAVVYESLCLGYLLATRQCTELEFAMAILAADCLLPKVFADVRRDEYRKHLSDLLFDAHSLVDFVRYFVSPGDIARKRLKQQLPNYAFLPEAAQWALAQSLDRIECGDDGDFSGCVVLLGKALESTLMEYVFERFRVRSGIRIEEERDVNLIIRRDFSEIERFARYVLKEPHYLELGAMMVTLEKYGGKTARRNRLLRAFFEYVETEHSTQLLSKDFVASGKHVSQLRNAAAHRELMSLRIAEEIRDEELNLLGTF